MGEGDLSLRVRVLLEPQSRGEARSSVPSREPGEIDRTRCDRMAFTHLEEEEEKVEEKEGE